VGIGFCRIRRAETMKNLAKFPPKAFALWQDLQDRIE
jgi:hypothetical protein